MVRINFYHKNQRFKNKSQKISLS